jgi:hypothetical protein
VVKQEILSFLFQLEGNPDWPVAMGTDEPRGRHHVVVVELWPANHGTW